MNLVSKADLHIHSVHSDGTATIPELLAYVAEYTDLDVIAITDHDSVTGAREAARIARDFGVEVIAGQEVSTADGHLLALFVDTLLPAGRPASETIASIHALGGLAIAAHPFDRSVPSLGRGGLERDGWNFDAIEGFNAGVIWLQRGCNEAAQHVAQQLHLPLVGGSDSHSLATIGQGYTLFSGTTASDVYRAIERNEVNWAGTYWTANHYVDMWGQWFQQRGFLGALNTTLSAGVAALWDAIAPKRLETTEPFTRTGTPPGTRQASCK